MSWTKHPWERIYAKDGRVFDEPFPGFNEVLRIFRENGCGRVLDLGCGTGRHAVAFAREGVSVLGLDISMTGLRITQTWAREEAVHIALAQADMRVGLPVADSMFDAIFSTQVIHHAMLDQGRRTIGDIHRILQPGGWAFVSVGATKTEGAPFEEIDPGTFVPSTGSEAGLPHHIFTEESLQHEFRAFEIHEISRRAEGRVLAIWARKPQ
jgi:SAM-dependent methyltransferase